MRSQTLSLACFTLHFGSLGHSTPELDAGVKTIPRGELGIEVKSTAPTGDVDFRMTLTNKSKELLVNTWLRHRLDGIQFHVTDEKGNPVKTRLFVPMSTDFGLEPKYIVLKGGESRSETINLLSFVHDGKLPAGKYKVKAVYRNTLQDEKYESKEVEVTVPATK